MTATLSYHVGDVHGRHDLLTALLRWIRRDAAERGREPRVVFLGDIVDRGPGSMQCMDIVMRVLEEMSGSVLVLGNHDEWFLDMVLSDGKSADVDGWILNGGITTIESYCGGVFDPEVPKLVRERYPGHVRMLKEAKRMAFTGPFVAVHAGIDPTLPLDAQKDHDLNWIRERFLEYVGTDIPPVIHGHTIVGRIPVVSENRVSIDTGAYRHGRLTCFAVDLERRDARFAQASEDGVNMIEPIYLDRGHGTLMDRLPDLLGGHAAPMPAL